MHKTGVTNGNAYMKKSTFVQNKYKNSLKMSVLYMRSMIFSMYDDAQIAYNDDSHMDKSAMLAGGDDVEKQRTVGQYRTIDLVLFSLMVAVGEFLVVNAAGSWFTDQLYVFSVVPVVTAIVMMRWGPWAAIHAVLGGLVLSWATGASPGQYVIYCGGNLLGLAALVMLRTLGKERVRADSFLTVVFGMSCCLMMQLGRALLSLLFGGTVSSMLGFFTADVITLLFTAVVIWIARRLDGVFEDQINYLLRINREQEEEKENFQ